VCAYAGVHYDTFNKWRARGEKEGSGKYYDFAVKVEEAIAYSEIGLVRQVRSKGDDDWRAAAWMLERRFPETWGKNQHEAEIISRKIIEIFVYLSEQINGSVYSQVLAALQPKLPANIIDVLPVPVSDDDLLEPANMSTDELVKLVGNKSRW
jgi:hypothetical protein